MIQGGVTVDGKKVTDPKSTFDASRKGCYVLKVGKLIRRRLIVEE